MPVPCGVGAAVLRWGERLCDGQLGRTRVNALSIPNENARILEDLAAQDRKHVPHISHSGAYCGQLVSLSLGCSYLPVVALRVPPGQIFPFGR